MRKSAHGKHGKLLTSYEGVKPVDCRNTRLNKLVGIISRGGIYRFAVYVSAFFGDNRRAAVTRFAHSVENSAEHSLGKVERQAFAQKSCLGRGNFKTLSVFEKLNYGFIVLNFKDFTSSYLAVFLRYFDKLVVFYTFNALCEHQRSDDFFNRFIFLIHRFLLLRQAL